MLELHTESIAIRRGRESDLPALVEIERASFPDPWSESALMEELTSDRPPLVLEAGGEIRGYLCLMAGPGERHVTNIAVHKDWRRRGLGRKLLESAIQAARDESCSHIFLEVRPSNEAARGLYSHFGFVELYRRKRYYIKPSEDGLVLVLPLADDQSRDRNDLREEK